MRNLVKKLEFKRLMAILLVLCTVMSTFITSINSVDVYADSNSKRMTMLQLGNGKSISEIDGAKNIDEGSLQVLAIYLSNFYIPFITVLDGDFQEEDAKDSGNKSHVEAMESALEKNVGMNKQAAEFLVNYVLSESLNTCSELLVRKQDLRAYWDYYGFDSDGIDYAKEIEEAETDEEKAELEKKWNESVNSDGNFSLGFYGNGGYGKGKINSFVTSNEEWGIEVGDYSNSISYSKFEDYCKNTGEYTVEGKEYVAVTYPIFLQIMANSYRVASIDTTRTTKVGGTKMTTDNDIQNLSGDSYNITNRTNRVTNLLEPCGDYYGEVFNSENLQSIPRVNFYYRDSSNHAHIVFSNSEECVHSFLNVNDTLDLNAGWGSALSMLAAEDIDAISCSDTSAGVKATCLGSKVYVNWEGSLILDAGAYRTPILPGCANPHMLTTVGDTANNANTVPIQNVFGIERSLDGHIVDYQYPGTSSKVKALKIYVGDNSLVNLKTWRITAGKDDINLDSSSWGSWGDYESLRDSVTKSDFCKAKNTPSKDFVVFPSWFDLGTSYIYNTGANCSANDTEYPAKDEDGNTIDLKGYDENGDEIHRILPDSDKYTVLGTRPAFGSVVLNSDLVFYDDLGSFNNDSNLNEIFRLVDIADQGFKSELGVNNLNTFVQFSNITNLGHVATYSTEAQECFRSLFFTYCFAYFNKDSSTFVPESNIVDLKMNVKNFPTYNMNIDWASLYAQNLEDQVLSFVYYLLHPTEGISYVANLLKNKLGGFLISWHEDIVGSTDSNSSTGMTKYLGTSSYTTTSGLYDVPWIATILEYYNSIIVYLIIFMCLVLLCYVLTGSLSIQRGLVGLVLFSLLAFIPPVTINATVNACNTFSDKVYSDKFSYWALTQMETWLVELDNAKDARSKSDFGTYAGFVLNNQAMTSSGVGGSTSSSYSGTKVKWMTPKRYSSLAIVSDKLNSIDTDADYLKSLLLNSVNQASSGETYLDSDNALYLYRDYTDIYRYGSTTYNIFSTFNFGGKLINKNLATLSKYYNLVPYKSDDIDTVKNAWISSNSNIRDITNDMNFTDYLLANIDYSSDSSTVYSETSSVRSVNLGFLVNTINLTSEDNNNLKNEYYFYNVKGGSNNTLALTYLSLYNDNILRVHKKYKEFEKICDGTVSLSLDDNALDSNNISDLLSTSWNSSIFNYGARMHSSGSNADLRLGYNEIISAKDESGSTSSYSLFRQLSSMFYSLYSESPYYYFNNNIRDQVSAIYGNGYNYDALANPKTNGQLSNVANMLLKDNQDYFYNLSPNAGSGFGELRDFMNMHDFFYYIIPMLKDGVDLADLYDDTFGLYIDDDCSLTFNLEDSEGYDIKFRYDGESYTSLSDFKGRWKEMNEEERYKFWHSYNTFTILLNYTAWIDTMYDCDYAKSETINVMGDKFIVEDPLNPTSYYSLNDKDEIISGRMMVFSRSEMAYYGLDESDLTEVERKIIELQDNVYRESINLMNYYTLSDETLIHAYAMLQTFEFNKEFSQTSLIKDDYVLYPQGYELKAFSYDAYLRMIVSEASGESLMTSGGVDETGATESNTSIYRRVLKNTSLFFALFLLINDVLAVYLIPGLKLFFIVCIFFTSIALIIAAAVKLEMNMMKVIWKSLFAPLLGFAAVSIGMSWLVSLFISSGANGVINSSLVINLGDPTSALIVMIIINAGVTILYFKICKKCFHDLKTYFKAVFDNIGSTVVGTVGAVAGAVSSGKATDRLMHKSESTSNVANTPKQRGRDNMPTSGKNGLGVGGALAVGAGAGAAAGMLSNAERESIDKQNTRTDMSRGMNKYDKKAFDAANAKQDKYDDKLARTNRKLGLDENGNRLKDSNGNEVIGAKGLTKKRLEMAKKLQENRAASHKQHAEDIANYGRLEAKKKQIGRVFSKKRPTTYRQDLMKRNQAKKDSERKRQSEIHQKEVVSGRIQESRIRRQQAVYNSNKAKSSRENLYNGNKPSSIDKSVRRNQQKVNKVRNKKSNIGKSSAVRK